MKWTLRTMLLATMVLAGLKSQSQDLLSVEEAIKIGLENNFNIKIASNNKEIATNNFSRGNAGFLPSVSLSGSRNFTNQNVRQEFISGQTNERDGAKSNSWNSSIGLNWTLFNGLGMFRTYSRLDELAQISYLDEQIEIESSIKEIIQGYYLIVVEKNRLTALDSSLQLSKVRLELARSRYELGKASKLDYLSAQVDYNSDSSLLIKQAGAVTRAKNNLNGLLGIEIHTVFDVPLTIPVDSSLVLNDLRESSEIKNRILQKTRRSLAVSDWEVREITAERMPELGFNISYGYNSSSAEAGFLLSNQSDGVNYGLSATWNLFNGNSVTRRYQNAVIEKENEQQRLNQASLELDRDLENLFLEYKNNLLLVRLEELNVQVAVESTQIALDRYRIGISNFLELREAQVNSVRAYITLINSIYAAKIGELDLLELSGQLSSIMTQ